MSTSGDDAANGAVANISRLTSVLARVLPLVRWWLGEIRAMLPSSLRRLLSEQRLQVKVSHEKLSLCNSDSAPDEEICIPASLSELNSGPGGAKQRCDLLLDESMVLVRELELPLEAESTLRRVLSFSMDRYTPFTESDVLFDYRIIRRDVVNKKLLLVLYVAPKDGVEPALHTLAALGIEPVTIDVSMGSGSERVHIDMCPSEWRSETAGMTRLDRVLALSALLLLLVVSAMPFVQRHQATARLESEIAGLRTQLQQAESDRQDLVSRIERMNLIQQQTSAMPAVLDVLLELTRLMSDESWAGQVTIKSGRVRLSGEASAASELLAQLSNSSIFSDPRFEAPLTQNPKTGRERFVISLAIRENRDAS